MRASTSRSYRIGDPALCGAFQQLERTLLANGVDAWQKPSTKPRNHALYLNPYAKHHVPRPARDRLVIGIADMGYDDFEYDAY